MDNAIVVDQVGLNADQVRVTGAGGTTINGGAAPVILSGVTKGARVRMGDAADSVTLQDLTLPGNVSLNGRKGAKALTLNNVRVGMSLSIKNGSALSATTVANSTVGRNLSIASGPGGQNVALQSVEVQRKTRVAGGKAASTLTADESIFRGATRLATGKGADVIRIDALGGAVGSPTQFGGPVAISSSGGDDTVQVGLIGHRPAFAGKVSLDGGAGNDTLHNFDPATYTGKQYRVKKLEVKTQDSAPTDITAPAVNSTDPSNGATAVARNRKIAVTFSEAMNPQTIASANVIISAPGQASVPGSVAYTGATMTFTPAAVLAADTTFTVTITTGAKDLAGNPLAANFVSSFMTGSASDAVAPTVSSTDPVDLQTNVVINKTVAAIFNESMDALTITPANFTLTGPGGASVAGTVSYDAASKTAAYRPSTNLAPNTTFIATIRGGANGVKDLAGNPLAANFVSSFTTGSASDTVAPTISSTNPTDLQTNVVINKTVAATFDESIDALTVTPANFTLTGPGGASVAGTVSYNAASRIASYRPSANLAPDTTFTATIKGGANGVKDLAGNPLAADKVWTFTTGTQTAQAPVNLGAAAPFAVMATASISGTGPTQINGDVGLNPGTAQGIPPAQVNGTIHVGDQAIIDAQAALLAAYNDAVGRSVTPVSLPGNMGGLTFTPGLYKNSTSVLIQGSGPGNNVTLDAQGDPDAIFIFQMGSTLTTGAGAQVILAGGAKASNIFWQVGTSATLNTTTIFKGNILASVTITVDTGSVVEGRLLGGSNSDGSVTVNGSTVTVPAA